VERHIIQVVKAKQKKETALSYTERDSLRLPFYTDCIIYVRPEFWFGQRSGSASVLVRPAFWFDQRSAGMSMTRKRRNA